jgi:predicted ATPase
MRNNWYVITGAPCSGKTTTLQNLQKNGYKIIPEAARTYIDQERKKGKLLEEIRKDEFLFQKVLLKLKIKTEKVLSPKEIIFFDRGIHDSLAYYELIGRKQDAFLQSVVQKYSYTKVFLLDMLGYQADYARIEDAVTAKQIDSLLEKSYKDTNHTVIRVPVMNVMQRVVFILQNL